MLLHLNDNGYLPSMVAPDGAPASGSCCLTGNCQFAIVWARLHTSVGGKNYRSGVLRTLDYVISTQVPEPVDFPGTGVYTPITWSNYALPFRESLRSVGELGSWVRPIVLAYLRRRLMHM